MSDEGSFGQGDYSKVMGLYERLKGMNLKDEADKVMADISKKYTKDHPAPQEEIQHGLEGVLHKYQGKTAKTSNYNQTDYAIGLASVGAAILGFASGIPLLGLAGMLAASTYLIPENYQKMKTTH